MPRKYVVIFVGIWMVAFAGGLLMDLRVAQWVHDSGLSQQVEGVWWAQILKAPGNFGFTFGVVILLVTAKQFSWQRAGFVMVATIASGLHVFLKWIVGRTRPYKLPGAIQPRPFELHPLRDGLYGFFHQANLSFPSGHACIAAALAASMFVVWRKGSWIFVLMAVVVGVERIAENAHFCSDVIGAFGLGVLSMFAVRAILPGWAKPADRKDIEAVS